MRMAAPVSEAAYIAQLAEGTDNVWAAACTRMGRLLADELPSEPVMPAGWLNPYQQILMQATALLIYALSRQQRTDPAAITVEDLRTWLASQRQKSLIAGLATMLHAAGHNVHRDHQRWEGTDDQVLALWWEATHVDNHDPTIDGNFGLTVGYGLHQLADRLSAATDGR